MRASDSRSRLAVEAALALVVRYLPAPWHLGDAMLFANARFHAWGQWAALQPTDQERICRYVRLRPDFLADRHCFLKEAVAALFHGSRFRFQGGTLGAEPSGTFEPAAGKPIEQLVDELMDRLAARCQTPGAPHRAEPTTGAPDLMLQDRHISFRIPVSHVGAGSGAQAAAPPLEVKMAGALNTVELRRDRLMGVAAQLDQARISPVSHSAILASFLDRLEQAPDGQPFGGSVTLASGPTQLLVAPTGGGKSVFAHIAALELARRGIPVALVLPDVKSVMRETYRFETEIRALGWTLTVAPVNSTSSLLHRASDILEQGHPGDPQVAWSLDRMAYPCQLSAYVDVTDSVVAGNEPCWRLRQRVAGHDRTVACPFVDNCPKFDAFRKAARADILVINHVAFLRGKVPIPLRVEGDDSHKMWVMELVFRRCPVVLVDEVDALQAKSIEATAGQLQLSSRPRVSPVYELLSEFQHAKAAGTLPVDLRVDRVRTQLHLVCWLGEELADLINRQDLSWGRHDALRWSGSRDAWLAERLFGTATTDGDRLDAIFGAVPIQGDAAAERLRSAVARWSNRDLEDEGDTLELRHGLMMALSSWPRPLHPHRSRVTKARDRVADALILRAVLTRLERVLGQLRPQLATLEEHGLEAAARVRDALLGHVPWGPSPLGPLGRKVVGFAFRTQEGDPGALHAQSLCGDPHGLVRDLGEVGALSLAGQKRVVLGLSATAYFAGSPKSHVLSPVRLLQPDESEGVQVAALMVRDVDRGGDAVRVSGEASPSRRLERVARLAFLMWGQFLSPHLDGLASHPPTRDRARALLVTGSYDEARRAACALSQAIGGAAEANRRIRYVVPRGDARRGAPHVQALALRDIESFGAMGADILTAPLSVIARGHNIVAPDSNGRSAIASIFVLVRPVPPAEDAGRVLAHVSYGANRITGRSAAVALALDQERAEAERRLHEFRRGIGPFGLMPRELRHTVLCDVLVDLAQLAGRCRRGGTEVQMYLVDGAFHDDQVGWPQLIADAFAQWASDGELARMLRMHRALLSGLARFAGLEV